MEFRDQQMIRPRQLHRGDTIGIVAPSSPFDVKVYRRGLDVIHEAGFATIEGNDVFRRRGYLAGSDRQRAAQFNAMIDDDRVQALMCARGGFGALKILDRLDYQRIGRRAKAIVGFSDITALLQTVILKSRLVCFHGPTVTTLARADDATVRAWRTALTDPAPRSIDLSGARFLKPGTANGVVRGGNLATLCHMVGTPYIDPLRGALLLIEDTGEAVYRIDRMLTQMKMGGLLDHVRGVMLGRFIDGGSPDALDALVLELFDGSDIPIVAGLEIGHGGRNLTVPLGLCARLSEPDGVLAYLSSALEA